MKRILITGLNSYVGCSFIDHVRDAYSVRSISVRGAEWHKYDFSQFDTIIHVAAIVHKKNQSDRNLYFRVNRDIPNELCKQAARQGIKQFIFLSTMAVYGIPPSRRASGIITSTDECRPCTTYGESKLAAEHDLQELQKNISLHLALSVHQ